MYHEPRLFFAAAGIAALGLYATLPAVDCNHNNVSDLAEIVSGSASDCNGNFIPDECDLAGTGLDFSLPEAFSAGPAPTAIATGDLDRDGDIDVVVGSFFEGSKISVLLNDGTGHFAPPAQYDTRETSVSHVVLTDLDGDGFLDVVVGCNGQMFGAGKVQTFYNRGNGVLQWWSSTDVDEHIDRMIPGDFDRDGDMDLVVLAYGGNPIATGNLWLLVNRGDGSLVGSVALDFWQRGNPTVNWDMTAADFDRDGDLDLCVVGRFSDSQMVVLLNNNGNAYFRFGQFLGWAENPFPGVTPHTVVSGDFNGDGAADIAFGYPYADYITVAFNLGDGSFGDGALANAALVPVGNSRASMVAADLDRDGDLDLAVSGEYTDGNINFLVNEGRGAFRRGPNFASDARLAFTYPIAVADLDGDGRVDLACPEVWSDSPLNEGTLSILYNQTYGSLDKNNDSIPDECQVRLHVPSDGNQDGVLDMSDAIFIVGYLFVGNPAVLPCGDGSDADPANAAFFDANGDGGLDISDAVYLLVYFFSGGRPPVLGTQCAPFPGCSGSSGACSG